MQELLRTNDPVLLTLVEAVLAGADLGYFVADGNMSVLEGSIGILPRRVLVLAEDIAQARRLIMGAGVAAGELSQ